MRTIKFRGKDCDGEWHYGDLWHRKDDTVIMEDCGDGVEITTVDTLTIGLYTNTTDSKGVEIFDGDILRSIEPQDGKYVQCLVKFDLYSGFSCDVENGPIFAFALTLNKGRVAEKVEVIGNIHDNPELWEGGEK